MLITTHPDNNIEVLLVIVCHTTLQHNQTGASTNFSFRYRQIYLVFGMIIVGLNCISCKEQQLKHFFAHTFIYDENQFLIFLTNHKKLLYHKK